MIRTSFNGGWTAGEAVTGFAAIMGGGTAAVDVTLPHDAIRDLVRAPAAPAGAAAGFFPGGYFRYSKEFDAPEEYRDKVVLVEFEGVYRDAVVYVNGDFAAQWPSGYSAFSVDLTPFLRYGGPNTISVEARAHLDSRWYTGAGIYRNTHLLVAEPVHIALDGVRVTTPDVDDELAVVEIAVRVENRERHTRTVRVATELTDPDGHLVTSGTAPLTLLPGSTGTARLRLYVPQPRRWDVDAPDLHAVATRLTDGDTLLDEDHVSFGIRRLQLDPQRGLRINGRTVKLRGACIHHDAGPLGSAAISRAEERRIEIMKAAGFNAIRSSHNSISRTTLEACDRLGMLVMDETFDIWTRPKSAFDYSLSFPEWWEREVEAMVAKDVNHPSVILYSIGNEIFETGSAIGSVWGRGLAEKIRELDDTRFVTNAINPFVAAVDDLQELLGEEDGADGRGEGPADVNTMITAMGDVMNLISTHPRIAERTEESHAVLDVSGLNYADASYLPGRTTYPNRILVGSETFPGHIDVLWRLVEENSHVIGDFTWTGWDYLGEAGIGHVTYPVEGGGPAGIHANFPALTAGCGDIDLTGHRRPVSYYREIVYGLRGTPYLAVHRPEFHGRATFQTPWAWTDSLSSWSFDVPAGSPVTVDVYSDADEVELTLDDRRLGRTTVGAEKRCLARFETTYQPGRLTAIAYRAGIETGRTTLTTAGDVRQLSVVADRARIRADDTDLAHLAVELQDERGTTATHRDRPVEVRVSGAGVLAGLGSGRTSTEERFDAVRCTTFDGRALAVVRPTGVGDITVQVTAEGCPPVTVSLSAAST